MNDRITESIFLLHICIKDLFSECTLNRSKKINRPGGRVGGSQVHSQLGQVRSSLKIKAIRRTGDIAQYHSSRHTHKARGFILSIAVLIAVVTAVKDKRPNEEIDRNLFISHSKCV